VSFLYFEDSTISLLAAYIFAMRNYCVDCLVICLHNGNARSPL